MTEVREVYEEFRNKGIFNSTHELIGGMCHTIIQLREENDRLQSYIDELDDAFWDMKFSDEE